MKHNLTCNYRLTILIGLFCAILIFIWPDVHIPIKAQTSCPVPQTFALTAPNTARWEDFNRSQLYFIKAISLLKNAV